MKKHTLNLFVLTNALELDFSYKLISVELSTTAGAPADHYRELQNLARKVRSATQGPAAIVTRAGKKYIAIPADRTLAKSIVHRSPLCGIVRLNFPANAPIYTLRMAGCSDEEHSLVIEFLEFAIRKQIKDTGLVIEDQTGRFFFKEPLASPHGAVIDMLEGFVIKIVAEGRDQLTISLDISYRYVDKKPLSTSVNVYNAKAFDQQLRQRKRGQKALMMFGDSWFLVEIMGFGKRIDQQEFEDRNKKIRTVYEYTRTETKDHAFQIAKLLRPDDVSVVYCYPGRRDSSDELRHGAASLMRLVYDTQDKDVQRMHRESILPTPKRFDNIARKVGQFLNKLAFNGQPLTIHQAPQQETLRECPAPDLLFNKSKVVSIRPSWGDHALAPNLAEQRRKWVQNNGFMGKFHTVPQYLFVPESHHQFEVNEAMIKVFQSDFDRKLRQLAPSFTGFTKVITYPFNPNLSATDQVNLLKVVAAEAGVSAGRGLLILPSHGRCNKRSIKRFHDCLKKKFSQQDLWFQCASYERINRFYRAFPDADAGVLYKLANTNEAYKFDSYLFYLSTAYLLINRVFPYALKNSLQYDIYIGIDVHDRNGGFVFFYKNGEKIYFDSVDVPQKNRHSRAEKLPENLIYEKLYEKLKLHIPHICPSPNGIILARDGRSHGGEPAGLQRTIAQLQQDGILKADSVAWAVVDIHKQSAIPLRVALAANEQRPYELPTIGTVKKLGRHLTEAFVFTTGYPFKLNGSARPLHVSFIEGTANFDRIIEDLFAQTLMAFSAPDRPCSLPIIIKLLDTFLEPLSYTEEDWGGKPVIAADLDTDEVDQEILPDDQNL
ncbi:hypothetical protein J2I47_08030 [Fibrella sp. HMF5335]|uniref:Piwi domain-containing protein n=1 Tax=Fibrella rubiginis TaxID=2817060 RepID=A0A939K0V2_9BACT|nr:hypothetical protein [Fibrella rubiginis]MBO0936487.1 hypothetical protein [Fibrella rubiginis]